MTCSLFVAVDDTVAASEACTAVLVIAPAIWFLRKQAKKYSFLGQLYDKDEFICIFYYAFSLSALVPKYHQSVPHLL